MKITYTIEEAQAKLQKRSKVAKIEIMQPEIAWNALSMTQNPAVARQNKIALIKIVRSLASDINKGTIQTNPGTESNTICLFDAKTWVESYSAQNFGSGDK